MQGRLVDALTLESDQLVVRFTDGSALAVSAKATDHLDVVLHEVTDSDTKDPGELPTRRQREYLDFIRRYMARHGVSPAESDIHEHFMVSPPSAHQMVRTLERRGFIERRRDFSGNVLPRSIRVLIDQ